MFFVIVGLVAVLFAAIGKLFNGDSYLTNLVGLCGLTILIATIGVMVVLALSPFILKSICILSWITTVAFVFFGLCDSISK